jgi:hypothetical protein
LKERWVITKRRVEEPGSQALHLRREEAIVERLNSQARTDNSPSGAA